MNTMLKKKEPSFNQQLNDTQINDLLLWKEITITGDWKLSLNSETVMYAMGECGNESVWIKLNDLKLRKPGWSTVEDAGEVDRPKTSWAELSTAVKSINNQISAVEKSVNLQHTQMMKPKSNSWAPGDRVGQWDDDDGWNTDTPPNPTDGTRTQWWNQTGGNTGSAPNPNNDWA